MNTSYALLLLPNSLYYREQCFYVVLTDLSSNKLLDLYIQYLHKYKLNLHLVPSVFYNLLIGFKQLHFIAYTQIDTCNRKVYVELYGYAC